MLYILKIVDTCIWVIAKSEVNYLCPILLRPHDQLFVNGSTRSYNLLCVGTCDVYKDLKIARAFRQLYEVVRFFVYSILSKIKI